MQATFVEELHGYAINVKIGPQLSQLRTSSRHSSRKERLREIQAFAKTVTETVGDAWVTTTRANNFWVRVEELTGIGAG